jgi:hypothetical protein
VVELGELDLRVVVVKADETAHNVASNDDVRAAEARREEVQ